MSEGAAAINDCALVDREGESIPASSRTVIGPLAPDDERRAVYADRWPESAGAELIAVRCETADGEALEHVVCARAGAPPSALMGECKVSYDELPPTALVEFRFDGASRGAAPTPWRLSHVSLPMLESYRKGKFAEWEKRMLAPTCKAELRRMFGVGPVFRVYDQHMFPSPPDELGRFEVEDDNGRKLTLPRPVHSLRLWDVGAQRYAPVEAALDGAPAGDDAQAAYWADLQAKIAEAIGPDEFAELTK